jgi:hypothetical protein
VKPKSSINERRNGVSEMAKMKYQWRRNEMKIAAMAWRHKQYRNIISAGMARMAALSISEMALKAKAGIINNGGGKAWRQNGVNQRKRGIGRRAKWQRWRCEINNRQSNNSGGGNGAASAAKAAAARSGMASCSESAAWRGSSGSGGVAAGIIAGGKWRNGIGNGENNGSSKAQSSNRKAAKAAAGESDKADMASAAGAS